MPRQTPQLENGYIRIACEWLEEFIRSDYPGSTKEFVLAVARETWGWNETWREVPMARLSDLLGVSEARVKQLREEAVRCNLVEWEPGTGRGSSGRYRVQKDANDWIPRRLSGKWEHRTTSKDGLSSKDVLSREDGLSGKDGLPTTSKDGVASNRIARPCHLKDSSTDTLQTEEKTASSELVADDVSDTPPVPTAAELRRQQRAELLASRAALLDSIPQPDRELIAGFLETAAAENARGTLTLGREVSETRALVQLRATLDHDAWRYGLQQANAHRAPNLNYVRKAAGNYQPGSPARSSAPAGRFITNEDGSRTYEQHWTAEQRYGVDLAVQCGTWDQDLGIDRLDGRHPNCPREHKIAQGYPA